jgi:glycosyltransferase involved in cell wall biosynthesis
MSAPRISIVIPSRDEGGRLYATLDNIAEHARHDNVPYEIVVIDDASEQPVKATGGIKLLRNERQLGVAGSRNRGVAETTGDIILTVDAHSEVQPGFLSAYAAAFEGSDAAMVCAQHQETNEDGQDAGEPWLGRHYTKTLIPWEVSAWPVSGQGEIPVGMGCGMAVRREAMIAAGGFSELFWPIGGEDMELPQRFWDRGMPVHGITTTTIRSLRKQQHDTVAQDVERTWANMIVPSMLHWPASYITFMWERIREQWDEWPEMFEHVWRQCHRPAVSEAMERMDSLREDSRGELFRRFPIEGWPSD